MVKTISYSSPKKHIPVPLPLKYFLLVFFLRKTNQNNHFLEHVSNESNVTSTQETVKPSIHCKINITRELLKVITYNDNNNKTSAMQVKIYLAVHKLESQNSLKQERKEQSVIH